MSGIVVPLVEKLFFLFWLDISMSAKFLTDVLRTWFKKVGTNNGETFWQEVIGDDDAMRRALGDVLDRQLIVASPAT